MCFTWSEALYKKTTPSKPAAARKRRPTTTQEPRRGKLLPPKDPTRGGTPSALGDVLSKMAKRTGLREQFDQARIWEGWAEIAGPKLSPHGSPKIFKDKVLHVEVDSAVWMNRYSYLKWDLIKRINLAAGYELVSDLFFVLKDDETSV